MASSFQIFFEASKNTEEIHESMGRLILMVICLYHLLGSNIINKRLSHRSEYFGDFKKRNTEIKAVAKSHIKNMQRYLMPAGKKFIKYYCASWILRK